MKLWVSCECLACGAVFQGKWHWHRALILCFKCHKRAARVVSVAPQHHLEIRQVIQRYHVINVLANFLEAETYLEIGIGPERDEGGLCRSFPYINVPLKVSVDSNESDATHLMTSDEFFTKLQGRFDIIFVDAGHCRTQTGRDIDNALAALNPGGAVVVHDCSPASEIAQRVPRPDVVAWNGDVWKAWVDLRSERHDLDMCVVNVDHGTGVIVEGRQSTIDAPEDLDYAWLEANRQEALNLVEYSTWIGHHARWPQ